ncbi:interferon gamma receptor 1-like [Brachionichthys hirsutus]|uniref:interferon gamma receptor 1-like n=1 Tax=Brachionichthys hirsutus TaxID=412623 RepID=UPI003604CDEB
MGCLLRMALSSCHHVFLFLACFQAAALAAYVEPPTNVTLHCRNMNNTLQWSYSHFQPGLKFKVDISALSGTFDDILVEPPALHADVSFLSDPNNDYYITVSAVIGQNKSEESPSQGIIFSYFKDSQADQKCFVDLPSINVTAQMDGEVFFHFRHPWLFYNHNWLSGQNRRPRKKSLDAQIRKPLPEFKYDVVIVNQETPPQRFSCEKRICEGKLVADPGQTQHCLKVKGEMQKMAVKATQEYCAATAQESTHGPNKSIYVPIVLAFLLTFGVLALVVFIVYKKKTTPSTPSPRSTTFTSRLRQLTFGAVGDAVLVPVLVPVVEPNSTPLVSPVEEESTEYPPARLSSTEADLSSIDEDEPQNSGYEKRLVLVQLSPDEETEGYRV